MDTIDTTRNGVRLMTFEQYWKTQCDDNPTSKYAAIQAWNAARETGWNAGYRRGQLDLAKQIGDELTKEKPSKL